MNNIELHKKYLLLFINRLAGTGYETIQEAPAESVVFLSAINYIDIVTPFIQEDIAKGLSRNIIMRKYNITLQTCRTVSRRLGGCKSVNTVKS